MDKNPISKNITNIIEFKNPTVIFTILNADPRTAATYRFTAGAFASKLEHCIYILCEVAPEIMQNEKDRQSAFEQIASYYADLGEVKNFRYMEKGCMLDLSGKDFQLTVTK
jgi:hypothetical protein